MATPAGGLGPRAVELSARKRRTRWPPTRRPCSISARIISTATRPRRLYAPARRVSFRGGGVHGPQSRRCAQPGGRTQRPRCVTFGLGPPAQRPRLRTLDGWLHRARREPLIALPSCKLVGRHNAANAMAALALCEAIGIDPQAVLPALAAFTVSRIASSGLPRSMASAILRRLQGNQRRGHAGRRSGPGSQAGDHPRRRRQGAGLFAAASSHRPACACRCPDRARCAGSSPRCWRAPRCRCALPDMAEAVRWCAAQAQAGDAVLLSPACASMDMYRDYAHRAEAFVDAVRGIEREAA
jgi:UDP-N-acetylmuramoylalanine--D-glutamate ligase